MTLSLLVDSARLIVIAAVAASCFLNPLPVAARILGQPGKTITVNTTADHDPSNPLLGCTLRDAIRAANTNQSVGGCMAPDEEWKAPKHIDSDPPKVDYVDQIEFDLGPDTPTIRLDTALPVITEAVRINGATGDATRVEVDGSGVVNNTPVHGFIVTDSHTSLENLVISGFSGNGIVLTTVDGDGIVIVTLPKPDEEERPGDPCDGFLQENLDLPENLDCSPPGPDGEDNGVVGVGPGGHHIAGCLIGTDASGNVPVGNGSGAAEHAGIMVLTIGNAIGGVMPGEGNVIAGNDAHGVILSGQNNVVVGNSIGTDDQTGELPLGNLYDGINVSGGDDPHNASCTIRDNTIAFNASNGVTGGNNACTILSNAIFENGQLGIDMADLGPSANDPTGERHPPPNAPVLTSAQHATDVLGNYTDVFGTMTYQSSLPTGENVSIELFHNSTCPRTISNIGQGETPIGNTTVKFSSGGAITKQFFIQVEGDYVGQPLTATATTHKATSEFSQCLGTGRQPF